MKKLITLFVALVATTALWAHDFAIDGIYYSILADKNNEVKVTFRGSSYNSYNNEYSGSVTIPATITYNGTTYSVTMIDQAAFYKCSSLTSVTIPNSVTFIGGSAFESCSGLTSVTIPNSVTLIGNSAFKRCSGLIYATILPNSVTAFGTNVFYGCSSLTSVVWNIKNGIEFSSSSEAPFYMGESQITSFIFGENVQHIPSYLCYGMSKLTSITIPNSVTTIGNFAFGLCKGLTSVNCLAEVPPFLSGTAFSYTSIPVYVPCGKVATYKATSGWKSFSNIQEPLAEYSIAVDANEIEMGTAKVDRNSICGAQISATPNYGYHFVKWSDGNTDNPRTITLTQDITLTAEFAQTYSGQCGDNLYWSFNNSTLTITGFGDMWDERPWGLFDAETRTILFPDGITSIGDNAFNGFINLTSITIPNSVEGIGDGAFSGCSGLTSIVWNAKNCANFSSASKAPFYASRSQITSFTFGESVQHIPAYLCYEMSKLTSITISESVMLIEYSAFEGCSGLTSITIPNLVTSIGNNAFSGCSGMTSIVWNAKNCANFSSAYRAPFYASRSQITSFTFGESVQHIPAYLCYEMSKLTSATIPNSVTSIGDDAFYGCSGLTSPVYNAHCFVSMPSSYQGVYVIPEGIKQIEGYAFYKCLGLTSVTIPNSVTLIEYSAFAGCSSLSSITIPNSVTGIEARAFEGCLGLTSIVWNAKNWNDDYSNPFDNIRSQITSFTIGDNVQYIPAYLCYEMSKLTSITIPNSVTTIGGWAFQSCSGLTSVTIGNSVTTIGDEAFYGCFSLTSVNIGNSVKIIRESAFASCSSLTSITIPNSVTNIKSGAFADCERLEEVSLGYGMEYIGGEAFAGCERLRDIYCYATNPPEIKESSFANYNAKLYVPCESKEDYEYDIVWGNFKYIECINVESAVDDIPTATTNVQKLFHNGQLIIIRDGVEYNVIGQEM